MEEDIEEGEDDGIYVTQSLKNIVVMLWQNKTLNVLEMDNWNINNENFEALWDGLEKNQNIYKLSFARNMIDDGNPDLIARLLNAYMTSVKYIDLSSNKIGSRSAVKLAHVLKTNKLLTHLDLK